MKKVSFLRLFVLSLTAVLLCACAANPPKKRQLMGAIQAHQLLPQQVSLWKNQLYLLYQYEGKKFYFVASAQADQKKGAQYSLLTPKSFFDWGEKEKAEKVIVVGKEWTEVLKEVLLALVPPKSGE
ncbi:MAG: hypothetical protein IKC13_04950, partial [Elusimicrobiaceae bacterium]|nr:hypothetical protein [Elusimicrobiaceae bacterium]